jgi:hypothetical protein
MKIRTPIAVALALAAAGCATTSETVSVPALQRRAAFDLNCPQNQLQIMETAPEQYSVKGCDQHATYRLGSCNTASGECTFQRSGPDSGD